MATTRAALRQGRMLPGFTSVRDISEDKVAIRSKVNILGVISEFRAPIRTRGNDWKCQMRVYDQSVENEPDHSILVNIFWPESDMPDARSGDVILVFAANVQRFQSELSLCTSWITDVHIYQSDLIPNPGGDAAVALRPSRRSKINRQPNKTESEVVSILYKSINKERLPTASEFEVMKIKSLNVKDKYSELKDVRDGKFVDTVVQIVKEPYDLSDKFTLWVSDYTENPAFYKYSLMSTMSGGKEGDPHGYLDKFSSGAKKAEWTGPLGKRSMQITCFEPHASMIREDRLKLGDWVSLRNLQIKVGHSGANLEGYLREDRDPRGVKINISTVAVTNDPETINPHLKEALRRKRDYERSKKQELKDIMDASNAGRKRKAEVGDADPQQKKNSKSKRKERRAIKQEEFNRRQAQTEDGPMSSEAAQVEVPQDLNIEVKCENQNQPATTISEISQLVIHHTETKNGEPITLPLPFVNANHRTYARVTDFMPSRLEDFARPKKKTSEYGCLSDHEESDSSSEGSETENEQSTLDNAFPAVVKGWEWRFYLQLEDAIAHSSGDEAQVPRKLWVVVDNQSAQMLLNLDASDLHNDSDNLSDLRQTLFFLWGDLEEHKAKLEQRTLGTRKSKYGPQLPPDHSDEEGEASGQLKVKEPQFSNRPFGCCLRQYGVKLQEKDESKADAGDGKRWERMFGLFGTRISAT